jgi:hypothetical protein
MRISDVPLAVLRVQYRIARTPLQLFEDRVVSQADSEAPARLFFERAVGALDAAAGNFLGDKDVEARGISRIEQAEARAEATRLDEDAEQTRRRAADELKQKQAKAAAAPREAREKAHERVSDAREAAEQGKQNAADAAASRTNAVKNKIDEAAKQKVVAAERTKRSAQDRSTAAENTATAAAEAELDDAADKRRAATGARAHADRLDDLSDAEKEQRRAARENDR